ncbi:MAG: hypothetical protein EOO77_23335 [Oxalobacteraceae bacterium]|nr:MAG: hypothetical protein EOO77_23335 [Oxalobacteraceae bacterium]
MNHRFSILTPDLTAMIEVLDRLESAGIPFARFYWLNHAGKPTRSSGSRMTRLALGQVARVPSQRVIMISVRDRDFDLARLAIGGYFVPGWDSR